MKIQGSSSMKRVRIAVGLISLSTALVVTAQQPYVYPAKGQSQQQQNADTGECQQWAKQTTGVDPMQVAQQMSNQAPPPQSQQGDGARSVARGAVVGGVLGGIGGRGGEGAAVGAVVGVARHRSRQRDAQNDYAQQQQSNQQQASSMLSAFNRAYAACMSGRGYSIQ